MGEMGGGDRGRVGGDWGRVGGRGQVGGNTKGTAR